MTLNDTPNIDDSTVVADHMDRCLYGVELRYTGLDRHEPYAYWLCQRDHTGERNEDATQEYTYDSSYVGIGSSGSVLLPHLRYSAELAFQTGKSYPELSTSARERIQAWANDLAATLEESR